MIYYKKKIQQDFGATAIEYGLIASLIGVLAVSGMSAVGVNLSNTYCTISKYLGGSGTCSGSSGTVSLADGATLADLKASLSDTLNDAYVDTSQGGTAKTAGGVWWDSSEMIDGGSNIILQDEQTQMKKINSSDPITNIFGIYDTATGKPITDYDSVMAGINARLENKGLNSGYSISSYYKAGGAYSNDGSDVQVTTQSGKVYTIDGNTVTESAKK